MHSDTIHNVANQSFLGGFAQGLSPAKTKSLADIIVPMRPEDVFSEYFRDVLKSNEKTIAMNVFIIGYKCD